MRALDPGLLWLLTAQEEAPPSVFVQLFPLVVMVLIFYVIALRPAQKERKQHAEMLEALKRGDEVLTTSGFIGTITDIQDPFVTLEISPKVKVKLLKSAVAKKHVEKKEPEKEAKAGA